MGIEVKELLSRALALLADLLVEGKPLRAQVDHAGFRVLLEVTPIGEAAPQCVKPVAGLLPEQCGRLSGEPIKLKAIGRQDSSSSSNVEESPVASSENGLPRGAHCRMFSAIEESILKAATDQWQTAREIAAKSGYTASTWFRAILSNLVDRECLEGGHRGYRLKGEGQL